MIWLRKKKLQRGFTLVEMITAVAIFSLVMVMAMGSLLTILNANKQNQAIQTAVNNLNLAMEMMSREIRVGYTYHCGDDTAISITKNCETGENYMAFEAYDGDSANPDDQIVYKLEEDGEGKGRIKRSEDSDATSLFLTAKAVDIEELSFYVTGTDITDDIQPRVLITVSGFVDLGSVGERGKSHFDLQTTVSQRRIDF